MGRPFGMDRNASTSSGWAGTTRERPPLPSLTRMVGDAATKFRSHLPVSTLPPAAARCGPFGMDRNASTSSGWAGTTRERPPLPSLTRMVGDAATKFRSHLPVSTLPPAAARCGTAPGRTAAPPGPASVVGKLAGGHGVHRPPRFYNGRGHRRSLPSAPHSATLPPWDQHPKPKPR